VRTLILATILIAAQAIDDGSLVILSSGAFHGDEVPADAEGRWAALVAEGSGAALRPVRVSVVAVRDELLDNEGEATGKRVDLSPELDPIVLLRGAPSLRPGPVATALVRHPIGLMSGAEAHLGTVSYQLSLRCAEVPPVSGQRQEACDLLLQSESIQQVLFTYRAYFTREDRYWASERSPMVLWAGDLDGDGRLDLLVDTSDHYNVTEMRLYVSSPAKPDALVTEAARFSAAGC